MWWRPGVVALVLLAPLTACAERGDCSARIVVDGQIYRSHNELTQLTTAGRDLGRGKVIDCGDTDQRAVALVAVRAFAGVDPEVAVVSLDPQWGGVFVREGLKPADWPPAIRASTSR